MEVSTRPELVLVMPAYNEEGCIESVIGSWVAALDEALKGRYQMVIVNDGSRDNTRLILDSLRNSFPQMVVIHQENSGHGGALYRGYRKAIQLNPDWVFQVDSDNQFVPQDFHLLWEKRNDSRFLLGFRQARQDDHVRMVITRILRFMIYLVFGTWVEDANVPFRLIQGAYLAELLKVLPAKLFAPNIFLTILGAKMGDRLHFMPVQHLARKTGTVSIFRWKLLKVCLRSALEIFLFRWQLSSAVRYLRNKGF